MPNIATHPPRSPGRKDEPDFPIKASKGDIPFTTLDIPHTWNKDFVQPREYQAGFQRFAPRQLDKTKDIRDEITKALADKEAQLGDLRGLYNTVTLSHGKHVVETRMLMALSRKIDAVFAEDLQGAIETSDLETVEQLVKEVEDDPVLAMIVKRSTSLEAVQAQLPKVQQGSVAKARDAMDTGGGRAAESARRASSAELMKALKRDKLRGWDNITFNPESGRLQLVTEVLFQKSTSVYMKENPTADFDDPDTAEAVLQEVAKTYQIFKMPFDVVQVHKSPYKSKSTDGGGHDGWMQDLAMARARKMIDALQGMGVPAKAMTPKVELTDRTVVMQYCQFKMEYEHIYFDSSTGTLSLKTPVMWDKRLYSRDQQDYPDAQFAEPRVAQEVFLEVMKIAKFYGCDLDVVIHREEDPYYDDEHKGWLDELLDNRADKVKDELVEMGLEDEKVETRVEAREGLLEDGMALHFEVIRDMRATTTVTSPKGPDHILDVHGCGVFEFNGNFKPAGMHNEEVKYRHTGGGKQTITFGKDGFWYMCINHDTRQGVYKCRELTGGETWKHCNTNNSGLVPVVKKVNLHNGSPTVKKERTNSVSFKM